MLGWPGSFVIERAHPNRVVPGERMRSLSAHPSMGFDLSDISVPVLVLYGRQDMFQPGW
jgi:pimeloyl-ACP methyl ester carboxylesterase